MSVITAASPPAGGTVSYYADGRWQGLGTAGSTRTVTTDIAPGTYSFAMTYNGTRQQLNKQTVSATGASTMAFKTDLVNVELQGSDSNGHVGQILDLPGNGAASYYADGWQTVTTPDANNPNLVQAQMLPVRTIRPRCSPSGAVTFTGSRAPLASRMPDLCCRRSDGPSA
ncbi:hypothetical protein [Leekyejoonella antrihumi]|uniref:Uncharacterized protein n=1 Tax=Leekyejoonella antrihumi TaxID=1660198 RepID=A0A563E8P8_9MICO|nr:hypothetical protein [Leekyejoonella antrihumi]TWP38592.1 hypothetical protein FGL98_02045 [Leekyejoonella antrihumi]